MPSTDEIARYVIHPCIGIARLGNAPGDSDYFVGPEFPGDVPGARADWSAYKDGEGRIKRQAARFRVYGYNAGGQAVREITAEDGGTEISWRVHVANRKAAWYQFVNAMDLGPHSREALRRNAAIVGGDRSALLIDPRGRSVSGRNAGGGAEHRFDSGEFFGQPVYLGELRTDEAGRLLFLGGRGVSRPRIPGTQATTFANNDLWHDDTCDGTVRARVRVGGRDFEAEPAVVAAVPPNYGQGLHGPVTMYDVVDDLFLREFGMAGPDRPAFWRDVFPLFERLVRLQWVNDGLHFLFGPGSPGDLTAGQTLDRLADPGESARPFRAAVFKCFRVPGRTEREPSKLPPFYGDGYDEALRDDPAHAGSAWLAVTRTQYEWLRRWADGDFDPDPSHRVEAPTPLGSLRPSEQPAALDRANLEDCLGGPFHPGIELTWTLRVKSMWERAFRLNLLPEGVDPQDDYGEVLQPARAVAPGGVVDATGPGTLTRWLGVPWQTDEASCLAGYEAGTYLPAPSFWAARVPNHVLSQRAYERLGTPALSAGQRVKHLDNRHDWLRFFGTVYRLRINDNVVRWYKLGIVAERPAPADTAGGLLPERMWVETEVHPELLRNDATWEQLLMVEGLGAPTAFGAAPAAPPAAEAAPQEAPEGHGRRTLGRGEM